MVWMRNEGPLHLEDDKVRGEREGGLNGDRGESEKW